MKETNLNENSLQKPARESSNVGCNDFKLQRFEYFTQLYHCVCSFTTCEAHNHGLFSHVNDPQLESSG